MPVYSKGFVIIQIFSRLHLLTCHGEVDRDLQTYCIYCHYVCTVGGGAISINHSNEKVQRGQLALLWLIGFHREHSSFRSHHKMPTHNLIISIVPYFLEKLYDANNCSITSSVYYMKKQDGCVFRISGGTSLSPLSQFCQVKKVFHLKEILKDTSSFTYVLLLGWVFPSHSLCLSIYLLRLSVTWDFSAPCLTWEKKFQCWAKNMATNPPCSNN